MLATSAVSGSGSDLKGPHIIDPRTGQPALHHRLAFATAATGAEADALSTAFFVMTDDAIRDYCRRSSMPRRLCGRRPDRRRCAGLARTGRPGRPSCFPHPLTHEPFTNCCGGFSMPSRLRIGCDGGLMCRNRILRVRVRRASAKWRPRRHRRPPAAFTLSLPSVSTSHDAQKRDLEQQAAMLKQLGFDGAGHVGLDALGPTHRDAGSRRPAIVPGRHRRGPHASSRRAAQPAQERPAAAQGPRRAAVRRIDWLSAPGRAWRGAGHQDAPRHGRPGRAREGADRNLSSHVRLGRTSRSCDPTSRTRSTGPIVA